MVWLRKKGKGEGKNQPVTWRSRVEDHERISMRLPVTLNLRGSAFELPILHLGHWDVEVQGV